MKSIFSQLSWKGYMNLGAFFLVHVACFIAFKFEVSLSLILLAVISYLIRMFGITAGYHRYFSHKSFQTSRLFQFVLAWIGCAAAQKGPLWWAAHHRLHHQNSDTQQDIHSPVRDGFWWSHMGWWLSDRYEKTDLKLIPDLAVYPELLWINRYFLVPPLFWGMACLLLAGVPGLIWGFVISTTVLWHSTFLINSAAHVFGKQRFPTRDTSRNNVWLALLTLGEGWHNNHHYFPSSANQGFYWWEIDVSHYLLRVLQKCGVVKSLRYPPDRILEKGLQYDRSSGLSFRPILSGFSLWLIILYCSVGFVTFLVTK